MMKNILFLVVFTIAFSSCSSEDNGPKSEFEIAKAKWEKFQFDDYSIKENTSCFCAGLLEWDLRVIDNQKDTLFFDRSKLSKGQTYNTVFDEAKTIEDAFEFIENFDLTKADSFIVEYDEQFGFPKSIVIDYHFGMADDEIAYLYSNFTPTK